MTTGYFGTKQTTEEFYLQFDFSGDIGSDTISTAVVAIVDSSGSDTTAAMIDDTEQNIDGGAVNFWMKKAGTNNTQYTITCDIDTSSHEHYTKSGFLWVVDDPVPAAAVSSTTSWTAKQNTAKRLIDKFGDAMTLILESHNVYNATADSYSAAETEYATRGVLTNPTLRNSAGEYAKSDMVRVLLSANDLPNLESVDFRIEYGGQIWHPERIVSLKPGGTVLMYSVDVK
ncbi:MAG: hypothetical protein PHO27_13125 [Sulfuricurvum sp.]|jgi:hypothetical protein|nr:hypothetical protein [Sulfuricurvum sp.]